MLNLFTSHRELGRFFYGGAFLLALILVLCLPALGVGVSEPRLERGAVLTSDVANRLRSTTPARSALARHRNAHRITKLARHRRVTGGAAAQPEASGPPIAGGPTGELTATEAPVVVATPPLASEPSPGPPSSLEPPSSPPPPGPGTEPPSPPPPTPEPPQKPPAPEPPPPAPKPPPAEPPPPQSSSPEPPSPPQANGSILFRGDFDSGFKGWYVQSLSSRATLFSSGAFEGPQAARFEVRQGDVEPDTGSQRSEVSGPTFSEGEDLYVRDAIRVPSGNTFSAPWQIVQQWHEEDWNGSPGMAVFLENDHSLRLGAGDGSPTFWQGPVLQSDRWYDLIYRMNISQSASAGFVEVWLDGVQQKLANGQTRIYGQTTQMPETYLKAGIYRSKSSTGTSIVEHDGIVVGTSYAAVAGA